MKFGFVEDFRNPPEFRQPGPELYRALLAQVRRGEELGYDNVWLTEHHFTVDDYSPAVMPAAAAIAAATSQIRIGSFVLLMPFANPIRVAEDVIFVDILSNGRFDLGLGQGYAPEEFDAFQIPKKERSARLAEGVELIRRLWTEENVTFDGAYTKTKSMTLRPRPVQNPPPLWIGARAEKAVRRVARAGAHLMATLGPDPAPWYVDELKACGRNPDDFSIAQLRMVYVADTEDQAWADAEPHIHAMMEYYGKILAQANDVPGDDAMWKFQRTDRLRDTGFGRAVMIGTPDQVARKIEAFQKDFRCTHFVMATQLAGMDPKKGTRALELFAKEVMPAFR